MYPKSVWFGFTSFLLLMVLAAVPVMAAGQPDSANPGQSAIGSDPPAGAADPNSSMGQGQAVSGTLEKISDGSLTLKTAAGDTKDYTIKSEKKSQIQSIGLKKGDRVVAQLDAQNQVVDVTRMGTGG